MSIRFRPLGACAVVLFLALGCTRSTVRERDDDFPRTRDAGVVGDGGAPDAGCANPCGTECCGIGQSCNAQTQQCEGECVSDCAGRECGSNGCGGSCGSCDANETCSDGHCTANCVPDCTSRECGSNGCDGSCGSCGSGENCNGSGLCVSTCTADCSGRVCGTDGCGGSCGTCPGAKQTCSASGKCQCVTGGNACSSYLDCCSQKCTNGICAACPGEGAACGNGCCPGLTCQRGICKSCTPNGSACTTFSECCSGNCESGFCQPTCGEAGLFCSGSGQCCSGLVCNVNALQCCAPIHQGCSGDSECCSGSCVNNTCVCGGASAACGSNADCCSGLSCGDGVCRLWMPASSPTTARLNGLSAVWSSGDAWAVGDSGTILRYLPGNGTWSQETSPVTYHLKSIDGSNSGGTYTMYAAGAGDILKRDSLGWAGTGSGATSLNSIFLYSASNIWGVGNWGAASYYDGSGWWTTKKPSTSEQLYSVHTPATNDVWAVGGNWSPMVWRYNGTSWSQFTSATFPSGASGLRAVWARTSNDVWAVGLNGTILEFSGISWKQHNAGVSDTLNSVFVTLHPSSLKTIVWAAGDNGTIVHWNGTSWTKEASGTSKHLRAIQGNGTTLWVVGDSGTILKRPQQ